MSNFVRVDGQDPINLDLVGTFNILGDRVIEFLFIHDSLMIQWEFSDQYDCLDAYNVILDNFTTTLNP